MKNLYTASNKDIEKSLNIIWSDIINNPTIHSSNNPKGFVLGGQPGSGKSKSIIDIQNNICASNNAIEINADEYRQLHPYFEEIEAEYGKLSANYTAEFSGKITESLINRAINENYNLVIEGTFRTAETPIKTLQLLKDNGYETGVIISTTSAEKSWKSTLERAEEMIKSGLTPRYTPKNSHETTVKNLAANADIVYESGLADTFMVKNRENELWNNNKPGLPSFFIKQELET